MKVVILLMMQPIVLQWLLVVLCVLMIKRRLFSIGLEKLRQNMVLL